DVCGDFTARTGFDSWAALKVGNCGEHSYMKSPTIAGQTRRTGKKETKRLTLGTPGVLDRRKWKVKAHHVPGPVRSHMAGASLWNWHGFTPSGASSTGQIDKLHAAFVPSGAGN